MKCRNYAHRGASGNYPENTMLAFQKALELGCEGIELDVQLTKDGEIVILHDETIDRTSTGTGFVKDYTYEELCAFDFSYRYKGEVPFQKIPTLREYFGLVKDRDIITNIELKTGVLEYPGLERAVYDMMLEYDVYDKVIISSFNHYSILRMKAIDEDVKCGFLTESWIINAGDYTANNGADAYHPYFVTLSGAEMEGLKNRGIAVNTWTVNEPADIRRMIELEVDGIISNYPERVAAILKESGLR